MTSSLVGSEMCIRDRRQRDYIQRAYTQLYVKHAELEREAPQASQLLNCLLYTSDAADDMHV
eukprot:11267291-Prorocentrum_lima.AAC.1